jgi:NADPH:quinone reductase-like Zn-dependent oxidoreductase
MRAIILREIGGPENLKLEAAPDPAAGASEVVVKLKAAALNHRDVWIRKGQYVGIKLPIILGSDGAGEVASVGAGVDSAWIGKTVVINPGLDWGDDSRFFSSKFRILGLPDDGTYAECVKVPATNIHSMPSGWSWPEAAALPLAGLTAYRAVVSRAKVQAGETVLVTGIGGGVSLFALQIAKSIGAKVYVTSGSDEKLAKAQALGAAGGLNYKSEGWAKQMAALSGGIEVVIDSSGGSTINAAIELCKPGGRIITYGATTGLTPQLDVRRLFWKQLNFLGSTMGSPAEFAAMLELYRSSDMKPVVDRVFSLADAGEAQRRMEGTGQFGKIVLQM